MFCPNCGKRIEEKYKFCSYCGAKIVPRVIQPVAPSVPQQQRPISAPPQVSTPVAVPQQALPKQPEPPKPQVAPAPAVTPKPQVEPSVVPAPTVTPKPQAVAPTPTPVVNEKPQTVPAPKVEEKPAEVVKPKADEKPIYEIKGTRNKQIKVYSDRAVIITGASFESLLIGNSIDRENEIFYSSCTEAELKKSGYAMGYLLFVTENDTERKIFGENSFTFDGKTVSNERMSQIAEYVNERIKDCRSRSVMNVTNELMALKELLEMGIISADEYEVKRKQLLNI